MSYNSQVEHEKNDILHLGQQLLTSLQSSEFDLQTQMKTPKF